MTFRTTVRADLPIQGGLADESRVRQPVTERGVVAAPLGFVALLAVLVARRGRVLRGDDDVASGGDSSSTTAPTGGQRWERPTARPVRATSATSRRCAGPATVQRGDTAQGVTDDEIQIGTISDPGLRRPPGPEPGAVRRQPRCSPSGATRPVASTAARSRSIERDAKLTEYKQRITEACQEDFFLVGGGAVFDETGQEERLSCLLPDIPAYLVSPAGPGRRPRRARRSQPRSTSVPVGGLAVPRQEVPRLDRATSAS